MSERYGADWGCRAHLEALRGRLGYAAAPERRTIAASGGSPKPSHPPTRARLLACTGHRCRREELWDIVAEGLQEIYFRDNGRRAEGIFVVFADIEHAALGYG
ncbi:hypothetical protein ABZ565_32470 [Streptomyces sp. NPDC016469]|uniref:hypothetical protein n=1 Tax=Streptomyces sp. NPDC016469 TaxID=3157191 RepID=UPI00340B3141